MLEFSIIDLASREIRLFPFGNAQFVDCPSSPPCQLLNIGILSKLVKPKLIRQGKFFARRTISIVFSHIMLSRTMSLSAS